MSNDYTPVPSYVAPTEGNMQQAATQIANWIRAKGYGKDTRESMAQAVQLFGDVAAQFINESAGLKGQFNAAIANENNDAEVQAARTSTTTGTSFGTLGLRLDAIDAEQASHDASIKNELVDKTTNQDVDGIKNFLQLPTVNSGRSLLPASDTGWLSDGITWLNGCGNDEDFFYRITTLGNLKMVFLFGRINLPSSVLQNGFSSAGDVLKLPSSSEISIPSSKGGNDQMPYVGGYGDNGLVDVGLRFLGDGLTLQVGTPWSTSVDTSKSFNTHINEMLVGVDVIE